MGVYIILKFIDPRKVPRFILNVGFFFLLNSMSF